MNKQIGDGSFDPDADFMDVAGTFNDWLGDDRVYDGNADGIYQYTAFGFTTDETIEYKARMNANWNTAEFPELGGEGNRVYTLHSGHNIVGHWYNDEVGTGVIRENTEEMLTVFPTPNPTGNFTVAGTFAIESVRIYSLTGKLICEKEISGLHHTYMNFELNKGMYLIKIYGNHQEFISKLVVF